MKKSYLYINMIDITELQKWYPDTIRNMKNGTEDVEDLNRGYIKEDIASDEFILLDGIYYSVIDSENTKLKIIKDDLEKYKPLENFPKLESDFLLIKKVKEYNKSVIDDKIKKAEELVEQAEELADKFNLSISWNNKFGTYVDGDWNSSSLTC